MISSRRFHTRQLSSPGGFFTLSKTATTSAVRAIGLRYRPRFDLKGQGLGATFHLAKWALGYVLLTQLVSMLITQLATNATAGGRFENRRTELVILKR